MRTKFGLAWMALAAALLASGGAMAQASEPDKIKQLEQELTGGASRGWAPKGSAGAGHCLDGESYRFQLADHMVTIERCQAGKIAETNKVKWSVEQRGPFLVRLKIREQEFDVQLSQTAERPALRLRQAQMGGNFVRPIEKELERLD